MNELKHYFLTSHFNWANYQSRNRLTKEFLEKYPEVICLEGSYDGSFITDTKEKYHLNGAGWATNYMLNNFIKKNWFNIASITFIDADIELYDNFFQKVIEKLEKFNDVPLYLQPYSSVKKRQDSGSVNSLIYEIIENDNYSSEFHTGYIYTYNRKFLSLIFPLPVCLVLGGYDTVFYYGLLHLINPFQDLLSKIKNGKICLELIEFYNKFAIGYKYDYIHGHITSFEHGKMINRKYNERLELYAGLTIKVVEDYFNERKEDEELY